MLNANPPIGSPPAFDGPTVVWLVGNVVLDLAVCGVLLRPVRIIVFSSGHSTPARVLANSLTIHFGDYAIVIRLDDLCAIHGGKDDHITNVQFDAYAMVRTCDARVLRSRHRAVLGCGACACVGVLLP